MPGMLVGIRCMAEIIGQKSAVYRDTMRATVSARRAGWRTTMSLDGLSPPGDVVEISPPLDVNNMTGNLGAMLVLSFLMGIASARGAR